MQNSVTHDGYGVHSDLKRSGNVCGNGSSANVAFVIPLLVGSGGCNLAAIEIAQSNAARGEAEAEAYRRAEAAKKIAQAQIEKARFEAEAEAQKSRADMETQRQRAEVIVPAEIAKQQITIAAEAEAERLRREAQGEAGAIYAKLAAEAKGNLEILAAKGDGYRRIIEACGSNATAASQMLLIEKLCDMESANVHVKVNIAFFKVWRAGFPHHRLGVERLHGEPRAVADTFGVLFGRNEKDLQLVAVCLLVDLHYDPAHAPPVQYDAVGLAVGGVDTALNSLS